MPLPEPKSLGKDSKGRPIDDYTLEEYREYQEGQAELERLRRESEGFRERVRCAKQAERRSKRPRKTKAAVKKEGGEVSELSKRFEKWRVEFNTAITKTDIEEEKKRRVTIAKMEGRKMPGRYEGDPAWDDVVPIPQDDGEKPLAAIAYTDEYAEGINPPS